MLTYSLFVWLTLLLSVPANPAGIVPDFRDLTIKTRSTSVPDRGVIMSWYFKGPRMRSDLRDPDFPNPVTLTNIYQCDRAVKIFFTEGSKIYSSVPADPTKTGGTARAATEIPQSGGEVIVTTDSVDTGERRQVGSYQARHVKTTITAEPGSEAVSHKSKTEVDGWYIDLTGLYCQDSSKQTLGWATASSGRIDRIIFKRIGTAPRGFAVEETTTRHEDGRVSINKIELIEISEKPLEESLFEVPADYSPASPKTGQ